MTEAKSVKRRSLSKMTFQQKPQLREEVKAVHTQTPSLKTGRCLMYSGVLTSRKRRKKEIPGRETRTP